MPELPIDESILKEAGVDIESGIATIRFEKTPEGIKVTGIAANPDAEFVDTYEADEGSEETSEETSEIEPEPEASKPLSDDEKETEMLGYTRPKRKVPPMEMPTDLMEE